MVHSFLFLVDLCRGNSLMVPSKQSRVSGNFGGWDVKFGGNHLKHSVKSEISL